MKEYIYSKTGNHYNLLFIGKSKHPDTGEWYKAVVYQSLNDGAVYTREYNDFMNKFILDKEYDKEK